MRSAVPIVALPAAVALAAGCGGGGKATTKPTFPPGTTVVSASLSATAELPKGEGAGSGTATVTLNQKSGKACWTLSVKGISRALSAHVHRGRAGAVGRVVIPLGATFAVHGCVLVPQTEIAAVASNPGAYYVDVHTRRYLNGAIRGQLRPGPAG